MSDPDLYHLRKRFSAVRSLEVQSRGVNLSSSLELLDQLDVFRIK